MGEVIYYQQICHIVKFAEREIPMGKVSYRELPVIKNREDALTLLGDMIIHIEKSNAEAPPVLRGINKAIGSEGYYWPRLTALLAALKAGL